MNPITMKLVVDDLILQALREDCLLYTSRCV